MAGLVQWEYWKCYHDEIGYDKQLLSGFLNQCGRDGWELVYFQRATLEEQKHYMIFKRPVS